MTDPLRNLCRFMLLALAIWAIAACPLLADGWKPVTGITTTYGVYTCDVVYGPEPLRITDMRSDAMYADKENYEARALTIYRPHDGRGLLSHRPVVFYVHGGGWTDWYRDAFDFVGHTLTGELGWITVVIDYRLTSDQVFLADAYCPDRATCGLPQNEPFRTKAAWYPDNIQDVAAAFAWTVEQIAAYGGDPNRITVMGHSAGGHLASLLATHDDYAALRPHIKGLVSLSGAFELNALDKAFWSTAVSQTFPGGFQNTALLANGSPASYVNSESELPPFYVLYAEDELRSLTEQNVVFYNRLQALGLDATSTYLTGYSHVSEMEAFADIHALPTQLVVTWITEATLQRIYLPLLCK